jgi:GLPGLI family protein
MYKSDIGFKTFQKRIRSVSSLIKFELKFNQTESFFGLVDDLSRDGDDMLLFNAKLIFGGNSTYYTNLKDNLFLEQKSVFGKQFLVTSNIEKNQWVLTNKSKEISGYKCYKAKYHRIATNKEFQKRKVPIIAWYCPEIASNFGPYEAVGLPGMVLEFSVNDHSLVARKINFDSSPIIRKPNKGKVVTKEEFENIIESAAIKKSK